MAREANFSNEEHAVRNAIRQIVSSEATYGNLRALGSVLAAVFADRLRGLSVRLVADPIDVDLLASGFIERLQEDDVDVRLSCFWNTLCPVNNDPLDKSRIARLDSQYHEQPRTVPVHIIVLKLHLDDGVEAAANAVRAAETFGIDNVAVMAPCATPRQQQLLNRQLLTYFQEVPPLLVGVGADSRTFFDLKRLAEERARYLSTIGINDLSFVVPSSILDKPPIPKGRPPTASRSFGRG
ncbi:hypothetical protein B5K08_09575 [Rhizobium leguminosarum bv. trifolii]|uniref:Uncharacterized protein n=1 Tax=Rhizobium leguminosarum bv. trifolii TaxID=386 RepID=A0A3E1BQ94_RHILT|nr:hypothetical protein [Rhizobium leguminosarum]RFB94432.1 hypothetical protein B5K08_09575 [Rhizobium leguminosarum bv. trifolii]RFB95803.1 hypothetical protein B5K10_09560 [Rhizobium leguminosarum bv. trifolii]